MAKPTGLFGLKAFDRSVVELSCARCEAVTTKTIRWLREHNGYVCSCGARYDIGANKDELLRSLWEAHAARRSTEQSPDDSKE